MLGTLFGLPAMRERLGIDLAQQGDLFSVLFIGLLVSTAVVGPTIDRFGSKVVLVSASAMVTAALLAFALATRVRRRGRGGAAARRRRRVAQHGDQRARLGRLPRRSRPDAEPARHLLRHRRAVRAARGGGRLRRPVDRGNDGAVRGGGRGEHGGVGGAAVPAAARRRGVLVRRDARRGEGPRRAAVRAAAAVPVGERGGAERLDVHLRRVDRLVAAGGDAGPARLLGDGDRRAARCRRARRRGSARSAWCVFCGAAVARRLRRPAGRRRVAAWPGRRRAG